MSVYLIYAKNLGIAMRDFVKYAAHYDVPVIPVELTGLPEVRITEGCVYFYLGQENVHEDPAKMRLIFSIADGFRKAGIRVVNGYNAVKNTDKVSLYKILKENGLSCPEYLVKPENEKELASLGKTVLIRGAESHNQGDLYVFHAPYKGAFPINYVTGTPMAAQFIETVNSADLRQYYRVIVVGNSVIARTAYLYKGYIPRYTHDTKATVIFRKQVLPLLETSPLVQSNCIAACRAVGVDVGAVDFLLPHGIDSRPLITDITPAFSSFRNEHLSSPFLWELSIVDRFHQILLQFLTGG